MTKGIRGTKQPNWGTGTRTNSTDREAMIEAFLQFFTEPMPRKAAGQLFDRYRLKGLIDIFWDDRNGKYVVTMIDRPSEADG
jgi:hypothetical protein